MRLGKDFPLVDELALRGLAGVDLCWLQASVLVYQLSTQQSYSIAKFLKQQRNKLLAQTDKRLSDIRYLVNLLKIQQERRQWLQRSAPAFLQNEPFSPLLNNKDLTWLAHQLGSLSQFYHFADQHLRTKTTWWCRIWMNQKKRAACNNIRIWLNQLQQKIEYERLLLAQTMARRLLLQHKHCDASLDDILALQEPKLRIVLPQKTEKYHLKFIQYIHRYGDTTSIQAVTNLDWVKGISASVTATGYSYVGASRKSRRLIFCNDKMFEGFYHSVDVSLQWQAVNQYKFESNGLNYLIQLRRLTSLHAAIQQEIIRVKSVQQKLSKLWQRQTYKQIQNYIDHLTEKACNLTTKMRSMYDGLPTLLPKIVSDSALLDQILQYIYPWFDCKVLDHKVSLAVINHISNLFMRRELPWAGCANWPDSIHVLLFFQQFRRLIQTQHHPNIDLLESLLTGQLFQQLEPPSLTQLVRKLATTFLNAEQLIKNIVLNTVAQNVTSCQSPAFKFLLQCEQYFTDIGWHAHRLQNPTLSAPAPTKSIYGSAMALFSVQQFEREILLVMTAHARTIKTLNLNLVNALSELHYSRLERLQQILARCLSSRMCGYLNAPLLDALRAINNILLGQGTLNDRQAIADYTTSVAILQQKGLQTCLFQQIGESYARASSYVKQPTFTAIS